MAKIGFIGTGIMGQPMAANLQKAGHQLFLSEHHGKAPQALLDAGAIALANPQQVEALLLQGAVKARALATPFMARLRQAVGLRPLSATMLAESGKAAKAASPETGASSSMPAITSIKWSSCPRRLAWGNSCDMSAIHCRREVSNL